MNPDYRTGIGFDVHAFAEGRKLIIGGVSIPYDKGLLGHSDADVLLHAISDALLGALALGDIGRHFPDTDENYKDVDSMILLKKVYEHVLLSGYSLGNIDAVVTMQRPKISPYVMKMRENLAGLFNVELNRISIKATTTEKLGFVGREEGASAFATVLILRK